jgi:hypothetical protein
METAITSPIIVDVRALRVLLTNIILTGRTGTEIVTRDLAIGLLRRGHRPMVYAPEARGGLVDELRAASIPVVDDIAAIAVPPDIIHGHHNAPLATAIARFPDAPAIFVCNDFTAWHDAPPHLPSIRRYVAIDETNADRLTVESGIAPERVAIHLNAVDLRRFPASDRRLPDKPLRALAFVKHTAHLHALIAACDARGIALDIAGTAAGTRIDAPEKVLPHYDLVFTSALSALEAMACGCAVIACDARGVAGFVTPERFARWRRLNFGLRSFARPVTASVLVEEVDLYDPSAASAVAAIVRETAGMDELVDRYVALYEACILDHVAPARADHDRAFARHLQTWGPRVGPAWPWSIERSLLIDELDAALERPRRIALGEAIVIGAEQPHRVEFAAGFGSVESHGIWTNGDQATMVLRVDTLEEQVDVAFLVDAFVRPGHPTVEVGVTANGVLTGTWSFTYPSLPGWRRVRVPIASSDRLIVLGFSIRTPCSPKELGEGGDSRKLGLSISQLAVTAFETGNPAS